MREEKSIVESEIEARVKEEVNKRVKEIEEKIENKFSKRLKELEKRVEDRIEAEVSKRVRGEVKTAHLQGWDYDPSEERHCVCRQVEHGEMVACDGAGCPIEWFHLGCVGLARAPTSSWHCPGCFPRPPRPARSNPPRRRG